MNLVPQRECVLFHSEEIVVIKQKNTWNWFADAIRALRQIGDRDSPKQTNS
jgi:hypothetical protein